jgi:hypothetical protein
MTFPNPRTSDVRWLTVGASAIAATMTMTLTFSAVAQTPAPTSTRIRGEIVSINGESMVVHRTNADNVTIDFKPDVPVSAVKNVKLSDIKAGTYIGTASVPGPDGNLTAREVVVFPESMRGTGDGHYAWDLLPGSMMTNANVDTVVQGTSGRELTLSYKGGSKTVTVPEGAPVVTFAEATRADVVAGRKVFILAMTAGPGKYEARRVVVEKDGVAPPM